MKPWKKKGAYELYFGIIGVVIALFVLLYFSLAEEKGSRFIGEQQLQVLVADAKVQSSLLYLDQASGYAVQQAIYTLAAKGGFSKETTCGTYYGAASWQTVVQEEAQGRQVSQHVQSCNPLVQLHQSFEEELNEQLQRYLQHDQQLREFLFHLQIKEGGAQEDWTNKVREDEDTSGIPHMPSRYTTVIGTTDTPLKVDILKELQEDEGLNSASSSFGVYPSTEGETGFFSRKGMPIDRIVVHYTVSSTTEATVQTFLEEEVSIHYILGTEEEGFKVTQMVPEEFGAYHAGGCSDATCKPGVYENMNIRAIGIEIVNWGFQRCGTAKQGQCPEGCQGPYERLCVNDNKEACGTILYCWQPYPEGQYLALVQLIADIVERHKTLQTEQGLTTRANIIGHNEIKYQKSDPGPREVMDLDRLTNDVNTELMSRKSLASTMTPVLGAAIAPADTMSEEQNSADASEQEGEKQGVYQIQPTFATTLAYSFTDYSLLTDALYGENGVVNKTLACEKQGRVVEECLVEATESINNEVLSKQGLLLYNGDCDVQSNVKTDFLEYYSLCQQSGQDQCICTISLAKDPKQHGLVEFSVGGDEQTEAMPFYDHESAVFRPDEHLETISLGTVQDLDEEPTFNEEEMLTIHMAENMINKKLPFYKKDENLYFVEDGKTGAVPQCREQKRMFLFCAVQQDIQRVIYDPIEQEIANKNVEYKFAIAFPDITPPKPVKNSIAYDKPGAEDSVILTWDKSEEKDIEAFSVFVAPEQGDLAGLFDQETSRIKEELQPQEFFIKDVVLLEGGITREDLQTCTWNLEEKMCETTLLNGEKIVLDEGILYETTDDAPYYLLVLHAIPNGIPHQFAITARDIFKNEINNLDDGQKINKKSGTSKDDLPPEMIGPARTMLIEETEGDKVTKKIRVEWDLPTHNMDGGSVDDVSSFIIKYSRERGATKKTAQKEESCTGQLCSTFLPYLGQGLIQVGALDDQKNIFQDWETYTPVATVS
ncbi:N-acetylmuramoyl-L-alanine amidase [Candidatus Woesearchaeota archaeon]|nr:N-acetylmuramoyl-L-alanine amidase [Candidatus Woesearchaeota archaeon]